MSHITQLLDELLEHCTPYSGHHERYHTALRHLRAALAQPETTPLAFLVYAKSTDKNDLRFSTLTFDVAKVPEIFVGGDAIPLFAQPEPVSPQFTADEKLAILECLELEHNGSDFEPECPACTARVKLAAAKVAQPEPVSLTDEQDRALCEAYCNTHSDEYFKARPQLDSDVNRRIFYAGHRKAWITVAAAKGGAL